MLSFPTARTNYLQDRQAKVAQVIVTAQQMREIENRMFAQGIPVAALMEKVAGLIVQRLQVLIPVLRNLSGIGILVGPGHNGGDALVIARELHLRGYAVGIFAPFAQMKELTATHFRYAQSLGIPCFSTVEELSGCELIIDGLFGFGLERSITSPIADIIDRVNSSHRPIISIDLPSGLHTDTGEVLGTAIRATHTLCLGLWKLGLFPEQALDYIGQVELIDFDIPWSDIQAVLGDSPQINRITPTAALAAFPLPRPTVTHKYQQGHLLLICGSRRYAGGAILTGLGARASGVGMLSIAVPESIKPILVSHLPEALIIGCPETETGAIASLELPNLNTFNAIACGPGLTPDAMSVVVSVLESDRRLVLDADGLNILAQLGTIPTLKRRSAITVLTPHTGEFARLFPDISSANHVKAAQIAAATSGAVVLLKGARTAIANPQGVVWINPESTPALARGGSGDVLTGLLGGLLASGVNKSIPLEQIVAAGAWCHSQAGILAAQERTELGVDALTLTEYLLKVISEQNLLCRHF
jgi:NAD(P)H-hydrate epimerase